MSPRAASFLLERMIARVIFITLVLSASPTFATDDLCREAPNALIVDVDRRSLHLCRDGRADAVYPVNLGQGGSGKKRQGDKKTPLGRYPLSPPRASVSGFTWFVPIGYPTSEQRKAGYTGGAIGIHGPPDWLAQAIIDAAFSTPWTDGCVMVRTKEEIEAIRAWILEHRPRFIEIRETSLVHR